MPAEHTFMVHFVDGKTGGSTIACHSMSSEFFKLIGDVVPLIAEARDRHKVMRNDKSPKNNYWKQMTKEASKYGIHTPEYLSMNCANLPQRDKEYADMLNQTVRDVNFTDRLKHSMLKARNSVVKSVKQFFERDIGEKEVKAEDKITDDRE